MGWLVAALPRASVTVSVGRCSDNLVSSFGSSSVLPVDSGVSVLLAKSLCSCGAVVVSGSDACPVVPSSSCGWPFGSGLRESGGGVLMVLAYCCATGTLSSVLMLTMTKARTTAAASEAVHMTMDGFLRVRIGSAFFSSVINLSNSSSFSSDRSTSTPFGAVLRMMSLTSSSSGARPSSVCR